MKTKIALLIVLFATGLYAQTFEKKPLNIDSEIQGDLYLGNTDNKTVLILIAGSGPTDRNGNQAPSIMNNSLKLLAEGLAQNRYNVFTFDKRVIAQIRNKNVPEKTVFEDPVNDVTLVIKKLQEQFSDIIIIGHSEGSLIGMLAAQKNKTKAFISLAGPGESIDKILSKQITEKAPFLKTPTDEILAKLKKGQVVGEVIPMLQSIFSPSVQPYLISWIKYDPLVEIGKLEIPVLIINGTKDLQVGEEQAKLLHQADKNSQLVILQGMNHIFKNIEKDEDNMKSYSKANLPLHPDLIPTIVTFLNSIYL